MENTLVGQIALIAGLGLAAQWLAWRFHIPAIVLLALAGLLACPVTGWLDPEADFGALMRPIVGTAVAVILFEGGPPLADGSILLAVGWMLLILAIFVPLAVRIYRRLP